MDEAVRSREARARAETALVRVLWHLSGTTVRPIVLGGLVPDVLVDGVEPAPPPHLGTTDVDVYIELGVASDDATLVAIEGALRAAEFAPDGRRTGGWRWRGDVDGTLVKVELLGERADAADESVTTAPSGTLGVLNLRGTGFVARDHEGRMLAGRLADGTEVSVEARARGLDRDFYDLVYVLLHIERHAITSKEVVPTQDDLVFFGHHRLVERETPTSVWTATWLVASQYEKSTCHRAAQATVASAPADHPCAGTEWSLASHRASGHQVNVLPGAGRRALPSHRYLRRRMTGR